MDLNVTTPEMRDCLRLLKEAGGFMTAVNLAERMRLKGGCETQRRHVRAIVKSLRDDGQWIIAKNPEGYFLTRDKATWTDYLEGRKIDSKRVIGEAARHQRNVTTDRGQGLLFVR